MAADARAEGVALFVNSAYRSYDTQEPLGVCRHSREARPTPSAPAPGSRSTSWARPSISVYFMTLPILSARPRRDLAGAKRSSLRFCHELSARHPGHHGLYLRTVAFPHIGVEAAEWKNRVVLASSSPRNRRTAGIGFRMGSRRQDWTVGTGMDNGLHALV